MSQEVLLPLSEYESSPDFLALDEQEKSSFRDNYFNITQADAESEDDYNSILKQKTDRQLADFRLRYSAANPDDQGINETNMDDQMRLQYKAINEQYNELEYNTNQSQVSAFKADDMEDNNRALKYKPFKYKGSTGYSVVYPDGTEESITGIENESQLTDFFKANRPDKFNGKREGIYDQVFGDNELDSIVNKMRNVQSGIAGGIGEFQKGREGIKQGFTAAIIIDSDASTKNIQSVIQGSDNRLRMLKDKQSKFEKGSEEWNDAQLTIDNEMDSREGSLASMAGGLPTEETTTSRYKDLFDSMAKQQSIKGSVVMDDFNRYVQSLPPEERGNNLKDFFANNPGDILPYIGAVAMSSFPDAAAGIGSATVGTLAAGPLGGAAAGGAYGMAREYSASLLSGLQERAASEGQALSPDLIESYMNDGPFMESIKSKAGTRAGVIGAADAVFGGVAGKIFKGVQGAIRKTVLTTVADSVSEAGGEALAQVATGEWKPDEVINEGLGSLGTAGAVAPVAIYKSKQGQQKAQLNEKINETAAGYQAAASVKDQALTRLSEIEKDYKQDFSDPNKTLAGKRKLFAINDNTSPVDPTAFEGEIGTAFTGKEQQAFTGKEQAPLSGQVEKFAGKTEDAFAGETEQGLTEDTQLTNEVKEEETIADQSKETQLTEPAEVTFKTERAGSSYTFKNGTSVRNKVASENPLAVEHKDPGVKESSIATVFVSPDDAEALGVMYVEPLPDKDGTKKKPSVKLNGDKTITLTWYQGRNKEGNLVPRTKIIQTSSEPAVGLHPMEFMSKSKHLGSVITEVNKPEAKPQLTERTPEKTEIGDFYNPLKAGSVYYKAGELSQQDVEAIENSQSTAEDGVLEGIAHDKIATARFNKLKELYPEVPELQKLIFDGTNLPQARELVLEHLQQTVDKDAVDEDGNELTDKKREAIGRLNESKVLAIPSIRALIDAPGLTDSHINQIMDAYEHVMDISSDPVNLTTSKIKRYTEILDSLADSKSPIGLKYVMPELFAKKWSGEYKERGIEPNDFGDPMGNWWRSPLFGIGPKVFGSAANLSTEINVIGKTQKAFNFIQDVFGTVRDNIDAKQLEEATLNAELETYLQQQFPNQSMQPINATRIGIVARLTQWKRNTGTTPINQIIERHRQLTEAIDQSMTEYDPLDAKLSRQALDGILNGTDITTFPDEAAAVAYLEKQLTASELAVLNKVREIGQRLLPALQAVKAMTRNSVLDDWANYVHDSSVTPSEGAEETTLKEFNSMSDVLASREGIKPKKTYPILDIRGVALHQIKSSTYEKHTGIERYLLKQALGENGIINYLVDRGKETNKISERLQNLLLSFHNAASSPQAVDNALWSFLHNVVGLTQGLATWGFNSLTKNTASSLITMTALLGVDSTALKEGMDLYFSPQTKLKKLLKNNFPTQFERVNSFDNHDMLEQRYGVKKKFKTSRNLGDSALKALVKSIPNMPSAILKSASDNIVSKLNNLSNSYPERQAAFAMWGAVYLSEMRKNGTASTMDEILDRQLVDKRAATNASDFVSRHMGFAADKASKGSMWSRGTAGKKAVSTGLFSFRQQSTGLSFNFQTNMRKAAQLLASGNKDEAKSAFISALSSLISSMSFRYASILLGSTLLFKDSLSQFFKAGDDEEEKRKLAKTKEKFLREATDTNAANSTMNNMRDFATETINTVAPVATSAMIVEMIASGGADMLGYVASDKKDGTGIQIQHKRELKASIDLLADQIQDQKKIIKQSENLGSNSSQLDQDYAKLELLESDHRQLTEKSKFRYFVNRPDKAWWSAYGGYGMLGEKVMNQLKSWTEDDLKTEEQKKFDQYLKEEFTMNDPLAGAGFPLDTLYNSSNLVRHFMPSDAFTKPENKIPTEVLWRSLAKMGQNPSTVLTRGREAMAKQLFQEREASLKRIKEIEESIQGKSK